MVGGQGLNLFSASVVVILEPQNKLSTGWQATGRAHRIGQTRPVTVYRLIALDTLEEQLVQRGHVSRWPCWGLGCASAAATRASVARVPEPAGWPISVGPGADCWMSRSVSR
ncbi:helicase-related protein [Nonomuraea bangladeshensis]